MAKDRRLGKGLAALLGDSIESTAGDASGTDPANTSAATDTPKSPSGFIVLAVSEIDDNPYQPRRHFDEEQLAALSQSLKQHDLLQPIVVRPKGARYELISGERRLRAAIMAGWKTIAAQVREASDRETAELSIIENLQRKDLNALEKADSFKRYLDEHGCSHSELAKRLNIDRSTVANLIRLLELPDPVKQSLANSLITAGHARALLPLVTPVEQIKLCEKIVRKALSVRAVEQIVQDSLFDAEDATGKSSGGGRKVNRGAGQSNPFQIARLEQELKQALGTKVDIREKTGGKGKIVIHFNNHDEFQRLLTQLANRATEQRRVG
ncbi:MAG: ParB/RepB/Spo0J family partition protein [Planctomycetaceae bacterium]|nr:ParB/RepB/Spo0J family partition protein [Planctomycetaceae bacterium]